MTADTPAEEPDADLQPVADDTESGAPTDESLDTYSADGGEPAGDELTAKAASSTSDAAPDDENAISADETEHLLAKLFDAAGIKQIVCVDDVFAADFEAFVIQLAAFTPAERAVVFDGEPEEFGVDGVWQTRAREAWESLATAEQASLVDKAYAIAGDDDPVSKGAVHALQRVLPGTLAIVGLSLADWRARKDALIADASEVPTLILFDQDFSHEGAGSDEGQRVIEDLESTLQGATRTGNIYYGLLTNKVNPDDEHERRLAILAASSLDPKRLVVISKRNLDSDELERFAARMRSTLLAPALAGLTEAVTNALDDEQKAAVARVETIAPDELERIVIQASEREGEWPADTMVRVLSATQRVKVREKLRVAPDVEALTGRLQAISAVQMTTELQTASASERLSASSEPAPDRHTVAAEIMHEEFYDEAVHVNSLHLPIELGDIIECPSTRQLWVVVAQPCALMVRGEGKRAPELTHTTLAKVYKTENDGKPLFSEFELPYFDRNGDTYAVNLGRVAYPRAVIVDACVLNEDGRSILHLQAAPAMRLLPHWRKRQAELKKIGVALFKRVGREKAGALTDDAIIGHYSGDPFKPTRVDAGAQAIEWDCCRIGRVGEPYARALLVRFNQYQARDAFLNDLAR